MLTLDQIWLRYRFKITSDTLVSVITVCEQTTTTHLNAEGIWVNMYQYPVLQCIRTERFKIHLIVSMVTAVLMLIQWTSSATIHITTKHDHVQLKTVKGAENYDLIFTKVKV